MSFFEFDNDVNEGLNRVKSETEQAKTIVLNQSLELDALEKRLAKMQQDNNLEQNAIANEKTNIKLCELNSLVDIQLGIQETVSDKNDLKWHDYIVATIAGGLAVTIDFLVVKTPKSIKLNNQREISESPLTAYFRNLGKNSDGNLSKWITWLEKACKVPYDKSIDSLVEGLCPRSHRLHSLAHDPSLTGLLWSIKDVVNGTFTTIDKNGILRVEKITEEMGGLGIIVAPILWLGHIISDVFTSAGIPIPNWTYLQLLQFGSFGDKQRTIADLSRYMYLNGYDMRHLVTMSTTSAVIHFVVRIYHFLVNVRPEKNTQHILQYQKEYGKIKNNIKLHRMLMISNSIAITGNITKIAVYNGNPLAINIVIWFDFLKESIVQIQISNRKSRNFETAIESRDNIERNFKLLNRS